MDMWMRAGRNDGFATFRLRRGVRENGVPTLIGYDNRCRWQWTSCGGTITTTANYIYILCLCEDNYKGQQQQEWLCSHWRSSGNNDKEMRLTKMRHVATNFPKFFSEQFSLPTLVLLLLFLLSLLPIAVVVVVVVVDQGSIIIVLVVTRYMTMR